LIAWQFRIGSIKHNTLDADKFSLGLVADSKRQRFYADKISRVLCDVAELDTDKKFKKLRYYEIKTLQAPIPSSQDSEFNLKNILLIWFDIFNSVFFGGGVRELRDRIKIVRSKGANYMALFDETGRNGRARINMSIKTKTGTSDEEQHITSLLHEMLHAFLYYYTCKCIACQSIELSEPVNGGAGRSGHGPGWANPMLAEAQSLQDEVSWRVEVGISRSVRKEMSESDWQPTDEELARWGMLKGVLGGVIQRLKDNLQDGNIDEDQRRPEKRSKDDQMPVNSRKKRDSSSHGPAEDPETANERSIRRKIDEQDSKWSGFNDAFVSSIVF
jgi:hypothetical protein